MSLLARLRSRWRRRDIEQELDEELQFHLAQETAAGIATGLAPDEARRRARHDLGGLVQTAEQVRDVRRLGLDLVWRDVRWGARSLLRTPRFTIVAMLTLALLTAGMTAVFAVVHALVLRPLPHPHAERLLFLETEQPDRFGTSLDMADLAAFRESQTFEAWGLCRLGYVGTTLDRDGRKLSVHDLLASSDLLSMFGIEMVHGRTLRAHDFATDAVPVGVIDHAVWLQVYGGDPDIIGKVFTFEAPAETFIIVGVAAPAARLPLNYWAAMPTIYRPIRASHHAEFHFAAFARVKRGVPVDDARREIEARSAVMAARQPETHAGRITRAVPLLEKLLGNHRQLAVVAFAAVSCVLLIGAANLVSLQLARNITRDREILTRLALGARRVRLARQLLIEAVLLAGTGGALGLLLATVAVRSFAGDLPVPRADEVGVNATTCIFAMLVAVAAGLGTAALPAWHAVDADVSVRLNDHARGASQSARRRRLQRTLLGLQTAVAIVLLVGAGLLLTNIVRLMNTDTGMSHARSLWLVQGTLPDRVEHTEAQEAFWEDVLRQARLLPSIAGASLVTGAPFSGNDYLVGDVRPDGVEGHQVRISHRRVSGGYFETIGMSVRGRGVLDSDVDGADPVVVVNELAASLLWPGQEPLGKYLAWGETSGGPRRVVGVVPTYRHVTPHEPPGPQMFTPYQQSHLGVEAAVVVVRANDNGGAAALAVASLLTAVERDVKVEMHSMDAQLWRRLEADRFRAGVIMAFAAMAASLALVGIVGLVVYTTGQRSREIAIRVALGAMSRGVVGLVTRQAVPPVAVGIALGLGGAVAGSRALAGFLVDMDPLHLPTFALAAAVFAGAAALAGCLSARAALRISPAQLLKDE